MRDWPYKKELGRLKSPGVLTDSTISDTIGDVTNPALSPVATYGYIGYRVLDRTSRNGVRLAPVYDGLRRVVVQRHLRADSSVVAEFSHAYNRTNNRLTEIREHHLDNGLRVGEQYTFDSLYRLTNFQVGTFTAGGVFDAPVSSQGWQLDGVGNWTIWGHSLSIRSTSTLPSVAWSMSTTPTRT